VVDPALEMEQFFGEADHFITFPESTVGHEWHSVVYIHGRYKLHMKVHVELNNSTYRVEGMLDEPVFYLFEMDHRDSGGSGDQVGMAFKGQSVFGIEEWRRLVDAGGDFSAIGIKVVPDNPVPGVEAYIEACRKDLVRVRPEGE